VSEIGPEFTGAPGWYRDISPEPDDVMELVRNESGWELRVRWWSYDDEAKAGFAGPREVVIRATEQLPLDVRRRGVTSGVMRRMERVLAEMVEQFAGRPDAERATNEFRAVIAADVQKMPNNPRQSPDDYYRELLRIFDIVDAVSTEPVTELAEIMGVPKQTLKTRLRVARQRQAGAGDGDGDKS
jgi:hypothetical protein